MAWEPLIGFKHLQKLSRLLVSLIPVIVKTSGQMKRDGEINNSVNLAG